MSNRALEMELLVLHSLVQGQLELQLLESWGAGVNGNGCGGGCV